MSTIPYRSVIFAFVAAITFAASPARAQTSAVPTATSAAEVSGTVANASSLAPVANAALELRGGNVDQTTKSDASGRFRFSALPGGTYAITTRASGYALSVSPPFLVGESEHVTLAIALQRQTTTEIKTIASVRINGSQALNTTTNASVTITNRQFVARGQALIQQALEQTPGVGVQHYNGGLGSVATLTIRGAGGFGANQYANTGYEVLVLQDGEPLRDGQYGDFDLSTLTPAIYSRTDVIKGVGGSSIFGANTIGGTLNLVTRDPMKQEGGEFLGSLGSYGYSDFSMVQTNTIGKFGYVFVAHRMTSDGPIPANLRVDYENYCLNGAGFQAVCNVQHPTQSFDLKSSLAKLRYDFSPQTSLTLTGTFESDIRDQMGLQSNPSTYTDNSGNTVSTDPIGVPYYFGGAPPSDNVWNIVPKIALDLRTAFAGGDLMLRTYGGILERVDGTMVGDAANYYEDRSLDRLYGDEVMWSKLFGRHTITLGAGGNGDNFFEAGGNIGGPASLNALQPVVAQGKQIERTYMLRDEFSPSAKLDLALTGYYSSYDTLNVHRFDPRLGVVFRPNLQTAIHASVGSGFAAPRIRDIAQNGIDTNIADAGSDPRCDQNVNGGNCVASIGNPALHAETAIGYDVGVDQMYSRDGRSRLSLDLYRTNLYGHIFTADIPAPPGLTFTNGTTAYPIVYLAKPLNLAGSVYEGFEVNGSAAISKNFSLIGYYDTQAAFPHNVDVDTEAAAATLVNDQQYLGVPLHKLGYGVNYTNRAGTTAFVQGDYQMANNAFNVAPFWIYSAGISQPLGENTLHVAWNNIFNKNAGIWSFFGAGVPYNGFGGPVPTNTHPVSPTSLVVTLEHRWGSLKTP